MVSSVPTFKKLFIRGYLNGRIGSTRVNFDEMNGGLRVLLIGGYLNGHIGSTRIGFDEVHGELQVWE
jgi:hypothetical protein